MTEKTLKEIRSKAKMTQSQMAEHIAMSLRNYQLCESKNNISRQTRRILELTKLM